MAYDERDGIEQWLVQQVEAETEHAEGLEMPQKEPCPFSLIAVPLKKPGYDDSRREGRPKKSEGSKGGKELRAENKEDGKYPDGNPSPRVLSLLQVTIGQMGTDGPAQPVCKGSSLRSQAGGAGESRKIKIAGKTDSDLDDPRDEQGGRPSPLGDKANEERKDEVELPFDPDAPEGSIDSEKSAIVKIVDEDDVRGKLGVAEKLPEIEPGQGVEKGEESEGKPVGGDDAESAAEEKAAPSARGSRPTELDAESADREEDGDPGPPILGRITD